MRENKEIKFKQTKCEERNISTVTRVKNEKNTNTPRRKLHKIKVKKTKQGRKKKHKR